jgi:hypothetical protein
MERIPIRCRIEKEFHKGYHRDSSHRKIKILEDNRIKTLQASKNQSDLDHPLVGTHGGDQAPIDILVHRSSVFHESIGQEFQEIRSRESP